MPFFPVVTLDHWWHQEYQRQSEFNIRRLTNSYSAFNTTRHQTVSEGRLYCAFLAMNLAWTQFNITSHYEVIMNYWPTTINMPTWSFHRTFVDIVSVKIGNQHLERNQVSLKRSVGSLMVLRRNNQPSWHNIGKMTTGWLFSIEMAHERRWSWNEHVRKYRPGQIFCKTSLITTSRVYILWDA